MSHVQVIIDGKTLYDEHCDSRDIAFINRNGRIDLRAGRGTLLAILAPLVGTTKV